MFVAASLFGMNHTAPIEAPEVADTPNDLILTRLNDNSKLDAWTLYKALVQSVEGLGVSMIIGGSARES